MVIRCDYSHTHDFTHCAPHYTHGTPHPHTASRRRLPAALPRYNIHPHHRHPYLPTGLHRAYTAPTILHFAQTPDVTTGLPLRASTAPACLSAIHSISSPAVAHTRTFTAYRCGAPPRHALHNLQRTLRGTATCHLPHHRMVVIITTWASCTKHFSAMVVDSAAQFAGVRMVAAARLPNLRTLPHRCLRRGIALALYTRPHPHTQPHHTAPAHARFPLHYVLDALRWITIHAIILRSDVLQFSVQPFTLLRRRALALPPYTPHALPRLPATPARSPHATLPPADTFKRRMCTRTLRTHACPHHTPPPFTPATPRAPPQAAQPSTCHAWSVPAVPLVCTGRWAQIIERSGAG